MSETEHVSEMDLLAYADGLLDQDPQRRAQVEEYLAGAPGAAERVAAHRAQTRALRAAYGARANEPVPDRLTNVLRPAAPQRQALVTGVRAAAMVAITVAAGVTGWYLGQESGPGQQAEEQRLPSVLREAANDHRARWQKLPISVGGLGRVGPLRWEVEGVALSLPAPDLFAMGYSLTGRRNFSSGETQAVALNYSGDNGANLRLLIAPVSSGETQSVALRQGRGPRLAYWSQGPLTIAAQIDGETQDIATLARKIRNLIARQAPMRDRQQHELPSNKVEVTADAASPQTPELMEKPAIRSTTSTDTVIE